MLSRHKELKRVRKMIPVTSKSYRHLLVDKFMKVKGKKRLWRHQERRSIVQSNFQQGIPISGSDWCRGRGRSTGCAGRGRRCTSRWLRIHLRWETRGSCWFGRQYHHTCCCTDISLGTRFFLIESDRVSPTSIECGIHLICSREVRHGRVWTFEWVDRRHLFLLNNQNSIVQSSVESSSHRPLLLKRTRGAQKIHDKKWCQIESGKCLSRYWTSQETRQTYFNRMKVLVNVSRSKRTLLLLSSFTLKMVMIRRDNYCITSLVIGFSRRFHCIFLFCCLWIWFRLNSWGVTVLF